MNEVFDITDQVIPQKGLERVFETYVDYIQEPIQAKIWKNDNYYATYSHTHAFPPPDFTRQDVEQMATIAMHYLRDFKNEEVVINQKF